MSTAGATPDAVAQQKANKEGKCVRYRSTAQIIDKDLYLPIWPRRLCGCRHKQGFHFEVRIFCRVFETGEPSALHCIDDRGATAALLNLGIHRLASPSRSVVAPQRSISRSKKNRQFTFTPFIASRPHRGVVATPPDPCSHDVRSLGAEVRSSIHANFGQRA